MLVQHPDTALHDRLGHEETRLALERSHTGRRLVSVEYPAAVTKRDNADGTAYFDAHVGRNLSGGEVISQEDDSPLFRDRNRSAFSGVQFLSSDSAFAGFDEVVREIS